MKYYYDLHIHSCLSPCADDDMTPMNIVGMAKIAGLDLISVTDHNSVANVRSVIEASKKIGGPMVLPGMELETSENIHVIVLFEDVDRAEGFEKLIWKDCFRINNRKDIYGNQLFMGADDEIIGEKEELLLIATNIGLYDVVRVAEDFGGMVIYGHVDRESHGALKILGGLDVLTGIKVAEISRHADKSVLEYLMANEYRVIYNSDAHRLWEIQDNEGVNYLELEGLSIRDVLKALK